MENMIFRKDYLKRIDAELLDQMQRNSRLDREEMLTDAEATALSIIENYLANRYNTNNLFATARGQSRRDLKSWAVNITLYLLHERWNKSVPVPGELAKAYESAIKTLRALESGEQSLDLPKGKPGISAPNWPGEDFDQDFGPDAIPDFGF